MDEITLEGQTPGASKVRAIKLEVVDDDVLVTVYPPDSDNPRAGFTIRLTKATFAKLKTWVNGVDAPVSLSRTERWMITNQLKILEKLDDDADMQQHYTDAVKVLENGYEREYERLVEQVYEPGLSDAQSTEVRDILSMFEALDDAAPLTNSDGTPDLRVRFGGFDGSGEAALRNYVEFLFRPGSKNFESLRLEGRSFISGAPMLSRYRRQMAEWKKSDDSGRLSSGDVRRIADAANG